MEIHLREGIHSQVLDDVRGGIADFGIGYIDSLSESLVAEKLRIERFHAVIPVAHPFARQKEIEIRALKDVTLVSFPLDSRTRRIVDGAASMAGIALRYAITTNRLPTLLSLVRNGVGVGIVPASESPAANDLSLTSRPLTGAQLSCQLGVMRLQERDLSPAATSFLTVVKEWLSGIPDNLARASKRAS